MQKVGRIYGTRPARLLDIAPQEHAGDRPYFPDCVSVETLDIDPDAGATSEHLVRDLLAGFGLSKFTILRGIFPDETGSKIEHIKLKLCHIDVDVYQSARDIFTWAWPRLLVGGIMVFDDYGFRGCEGVTSLVNELKGQGLRVIYNLNGHAVICRVGNEKPL
ncbi:MAG TPA: TylF/MycF/NovP-related O-methyltransferase [Candidatus Saccharimonadales bacterium]|nr:TylF/MycF/NovP-related O-methyltransferase [Candidatus Saccharimonadales bacterium]